MTVPAAAGAHAPIAETVLTISGVYVATCVMRRRAIITVVVRGNAGNSVHHRKNRSPFSQPNQVAALPTAHIIRVTTIVVITDGVA